MSKTTLEAAYPLIREKLDAGGTVTFVPNGTSMLPMLRSGKDVVVLAQKPSGRLKKFDLPLYRRENGAFVLHRIVGFGKDGSYTMCGDHQFAMEKGITDEQIIALVTSFQRKGKKYTVRSLRYRFYACFWCYSRPIRRAFGGVKWRVKKLFHK